MKICKATKQKIYEPGIDNDVLTSMPIGFEYFEDTPICRELKDCKCHNYWDSELEECDICKVRWDKVSATARTEKFAVDKRCGENFRLSNCSCRIIKSFRIYPSDLSS